MESKYECMLSHWQIHFELPWNVVRGFHGGREDSEDRFKRDPQTIKIVQTMPNSAFGHMHAVPLASVELVLQ